MAVVSASKLQAGFHLKQADLLPECSGCPLCLGTGKRKRVLRLQNEPDVYLLKCGKCRGNSSSRMPTPEALERYYSRYYEGSDSPITFEDPEGFAQHIMTTAAKFLGGKCVSILDFGGGGGDLSNAIAEVLLANGSVKVEIDLVDFNSNLTGVPIAGIVVRPHQTLGEVMEGHFDLVLASAILEHIPAPRSTLIDLLSRIKPGGLFYARTPSVAPILRIFQFLGLSYDFTFPGHVHDLGQAFWENVPHLVEAETGPLRILSSRPSVVETSFSKNPVRTLVAYTLKAPWYVLGSSYGWVGGWEIVMQKCTRDSLDTKAPGDSKPLE